MGNCARRLTGRELEEMIRSNARPSGTTHVTSNFHTALEECNSSSLDEVVVDSLSGARSSVEPKSEYFSARVEEMMQSKSQFSSVVEHEIEHSRAHWSEVSGLFDFSEDNNDYKEVNQENAKVFTELMNDPQWKHHHWGKFFRKWSYWMLGQKVAEGGQAEIFEVIRKDRNVDHDLLLKVFKRGSRLSDFKKQWPRGILRYEVNSVVGNGIMLDNGRFGFLMLRCWGDLRKLIDQAMEEKKNQGPPFPYEFNGRTLHVKDILRQVANNMVLLHKKGIIHRDLKAANILLQVLDKGAFFRVEDFESSIGIIGTGFWRAPEILLALKNRSAIEFSEKADVYSYAMTCFEVVTSRLPFEGELGACRVSNDLIIEGQRPKLPSDLDVVLKDLIERCWNPIPNKRPSFLEIIEVLDA